MLKTAYLTNPHCFAHWVHFRIPWIKKTWSQNGEKNHIGISMIEERMTSENGRQRQGKHCLSYSWIPHVSQRQQQSPLPPPRNSWARNPRMSWKQQPSSWPLPRQYQHNLSPSQTLPCFNVIIQICLMKICGNSSLLHLHLPHGLLCIRQLQSSSAWWKYRQCHRLKWRDQLRSTPICPGMFMLLES